MAFNLTTDHAGETDLSIRTSRRAYSGRSVSAEAGNTAVSSVTDRPAMLSRPF